MTRANEVLPVGGETGGRIGRNDQTETVPRLDLSPRGEAKNNSCEALQLERLV